MKINDLCNSGEKQWRKTNWSVVNFRIWGRYFTVVRLRKRRETSRIHPVRSRPPKLLQERHPSSSLERYGVHVINLIVTRESRAQWLANVRGVARPNRDVPQRC